MSFEESLRLAVNSGEGIYGDADTVTHENLQKLHKLLDAPPSLRKHLAMRILEHRATLWIHDQYPGKTTTGNIDWRAVPWEQIITGLLKVLFMILPFIL